MSKYIIAHDLGTSGNKATLFSTEGKLIKSTVCSYDTHYYNVNWAEQNPEDWWNAVCDSTKRLLEGYDPEDVLVISFSGHMMGCLPVDVSGQPLYPHILWADTRSTEEAQELAGRIDPRAYYDMIGHQLCPNYTLTKIMWLKKHRPELYARTHCFFQAKDYIVYRLTGKMMTDVSDASGTAMLNIHTFEWATPILELAGIDLGKLPRIMPSTTVAGTVLPQAAENCGLSTKTQVVIGGGDGSCASLGAGSIAPGKTYSCLGTSAWLATTAAGPVLDAKMVLTNWAHVVPNHVAVIGTMQAAGASFSWLKNNLCMAESIRAGEMNCSPYDLINEEIAKAPAGANGLLFLPYLMGERSPRWNADAKGCFLGLKMTNTRADMMRSVIEGIGYNLRLVLEAMLANGVSVDRIDLVGGMAKGQIERQIFADIWKRPIALLNYIEEAGSIGAAVVGGVGIGVFESFDEVDRFMHVTDMVLPQPETTALYDAYHEAFDQAYDLLCPLFTKLTELTKG